MDDRLKLIESAISKIIRRVIREGKFDVETGKTQFAYDSIAKRTGLRSSAVEQFVDKNNIDLIKLTMDIGSRKLNPTDLVTAIVGNPNNRYFKQIVTAYQNKSMSESKLNKNQIKEAVKNVNIPLPGCNLYVKGWGVGKSGNMQIIIGLPNEKGVPIQTNANLPETHWILRRAHKELSDDELSEIVNEIVPYIQQYGPSTLKSRIKIYKK